MPSRSESLYWVEVFANHDDLGDMLAVTEWVVAVSVWIPKYSRWKPVSSQPHAAKVVAVAHACEAIKMMKRLGHPPPFVRGIPGMDSMGVK